MGESRTLICQKCLKELVPRKTDFSYLGHSFFTEILKCPECGQVFIPEEIAKGRIAEVEMQLEDK
jgi:hypothetical protein